MNLHTPQELIDDIKQGKMVILMDDEDRENEGDFIMAAELVTPEAINFMATHGRGLICMPMTIERCKKLNLPLMVSKNDAQFSTNFTVSIEAAEGVTTGISAADRAKTVLAAVSKEANQHSIVQPGHIFPLMAKDGGVLNRAGHTEAGVDLARLAGLEPASVIVEILNEDGTMARRPDLEVIAERHGIKMGTIADLIEYRNANETTIERVSQCKLPTAFGEFELTVFKDTIDGQAHFALTNGVIEHETPTLVRVHLENTFRDLLFSQRESVAKWPIGDALARIGKEGGVLVLLGKHESPDELITQVKKYAKLDAGEEVKEVQRHIGSRNVGVGSQILANLGVGKMRLLSSQVKYHSLSGFGLEVVEYINEE
ncbi:bifunctional 3,4-dihydroxy-2-butanone-4-phosphate synthase/GTP cyclohydrolase II [Thalassotalea sp. 1_MG-2023]|uniref:bifunctional 3,4-dihydroxy-2-butanone-4-phosphate synthase/GTP cyclohydrolase II n=1 Tax=Thalassotalea sp. 1_MG-2023 TaxID=3062680 RepID=UPI0026E410C1|nr:bifunctional 3,4-dihydroxy-2-butanone-4-phosphate synthase/GTP cyclohydrolase II [Thalassotalea sp. 1_MG-2023]MDO6426334.1 bifunctional 3,4-dihydroxy-2-butanone-4-phosphate synthase/GTP cyclohydrolase II [Thalassotalea sp. 1_MG-2023]